MSLEDELEKITQTTDILAVQEETEHHHKIETFAKISAKNFKDICTNWAKNGLRTCQAYAGVNSYTIEHWLPQVYYFSDKDYVSCLTPYNRMAYADKDLYIRLLKESLAQQGFTKAVVYLSPITTVVRKRRFFRYYDKETKIADGVMIETSW